MIIYTTSFLMFPVLLVVWAIDAVLLLVLVRLACDRLTVAPPNPAWRQGLLALTEPFIGCVRSLLDRLGRAKLTARGAWITLITGLLVIRYLLVWLLVAIS